MAQALEPSPYAQALGRGPTQPHGSPLNCGPGAVWGFPGALRGYQVTMVSYNPTQSTNGPWRSGSAPPPWHGCWTQGQSLWPGLRHQGARAHQDRNRLRLQSGGLWQGFSPQATSMSKETQGFLEG